jgi:hypothetical protein
VGLTLGDRDVYIVYLANLDGGMAVSGKPLQIYLRPDQDRALSTSAS